MVSTDLWGKIEARIDLPPLPRTAARLRQLCSDDDSELEAVARVIEEDPVLAAKVLAYANSAYFGLNEEVRSIARATMTLGLSSVYNLVLQTEIFEKYVSTGVSDFAFEELWRHCILTAQLCRDLHRSCRSENQGTTLAADELYTCGLLHDLGRVSMVFSLGDDYAQLLRQGRRDGTPSYHLERKQYGYTHTEVGAMIAQLWGLPRLVADAIEGHHLPRVRLRSQPFTIAVAVADELAHIAQDGDKIDALHYSTNPVFGYLGYSLEGTGELVAQAKEYLELIEVH
jgi:putative nucleotidyltransferase with HDIG domain